MKPTTDALMTLGHAWRQALADAHQARKERDAARAEVARLRALCAEAAPVLDRLIRREIAAGRQASWVSCSLGGCPKCAGSTLAARLAAAGKGET